MLEFLELLRQQAGLMSVLEMIGVLLAVAYLVLIIRQNIWCWYCAAVSTALFTYVFFDAALYMEALLQVFYFALAVYGWYKWRTHRNEQELPVSVWPIAVHSAALTVIVAITLVSGYLLDTRSDAAFPYIDSFTSWAAIWATYLVARKVLENWWYWLIIDATMVYVFWVKGLELTAVLYLLYICLIPVGLLAWTRSYQATRS